MLVFCSNVYPCGETPQDIAPLFYAIAQALENGWTKASTDCGDWWLEEED